VTRSKATWVYGSLGAVLIAVWLTSAKVDVIYESTDYSSVEVGFGVLNVQWTDGYAGTQPGGRWLVRHNREPLHWWYSNLTWDYTRRVELPLWPLAIPPIVLTAWSAARGCTRARRTRTCSVCGYDLQGLSTDARCPECSAEPTR